MSSAALRRLSDVRLVDAPEVGGKAASLGELVAAGVRVPPGFVLPVPAAGMTADERRSVLRSAAMQLGADRFAVRSSAIGEDGSDASLAGMYETVLDVSEDDLAAAMDRVLGSAGATRIAAYGHAATDGMAVIVQVMVEPAAAGVALTADPISGDRRTCVVTAVRGSGERLVSGAALGDEWRIRDANAASRRTPEGALERRQALDVAREARRIAESRGAPQDVEWAIDPAGTLWILQARPMTALPPDLSWEPPSPGAYSRSFRLGEWISEPVTPLFESWLLSAMEDGLHAQLYRWVGQRAPRPYHVVVNGWYFYSINWLGPAAMARNAPRLIGHLIREPRRVAGLVPPTVRHSIPLFEREWREDLQPRYRAAVAAAEARIETVPVAELPALIDRLADLAGESFASLAALGGAAYKLEINLARFHRRHLAASSGGSHLALLVGLQAPESLDRHAVASLDWWHPPGPTGAPAGPSLAHASLVDQRHAAEEAAYRALSGSPRRLRAFRRLLTETQHVIPIREEQVRELTLPWPVMRRAVLRIGESLAARGVVAWPDDVFFLTRREALEALAGGRLAETVDVVERRALRADRQRLVPPLLIGRVNPLLQRMWDAFPRMLGADPSATALVSGAPASPGRATGPVRVIRGPDAFDELQPGEVLVAPLTAPAWTPLFARAAAVVTDVGSAAAHASIIAREYGIPAVVGCGDATARLRTGMRVTVDGGTGNIEPA